MRKILQSILEIISKLIPGSTERRKVKTLEVDGDVFDEDTGDSEYHPER